MKCTLNPMCKTINERNVVQFVRKLSRSTNSPSDWPTISCEFSSFLNHQKDFLTRFQRSTKSSSTSNISETKWVTLFESVLLASFHIIQSLPKNFSRSWGNSTNYKSNWTETLGTLSEMSTSTGNRERRDSYHCHMRRINSMCNIFSYCWDGG